MASDNQAHIDLTQLCKNIAATEKVRDVKISPDGTRVIYQVQSFYKAGDSYSHIWTAKTGVAGSARPLTDGLVNDKSAVFRPGSNAVLFISDRHKNKGATIFWTSLDDTNSEARPAEPQQLLQHNVKAFEVSPDGLFVVFVVQEKPKSLVDEGDVKVFGADAEPTTSKFAVYDFIQKEVIILEGTKTGRSIESCCWSPDGKEILYRLRQGQGTEFSEMQIEVYRVVVGPNNIPKLVGVYPRSPSGANIWGNHGISIVQNYIPSNILDARAFFSHGLTEGISQSALICQLYGETEDAVRIVNASTSGEEWGDFIAVEVCTDIDTHIDIVSLYPTPQIIATIFQTQDDAIWFGAWDARRTVDQEGRVSYIVAAVLSSGPRHEPPNVWTKITSSEAAIDEKLKLSSHLSWLVEAPKVETEVIRWQGESGVELNGIAYWRDNGQPGPRPTLVFLHGGPYRRMILDYMPYYCSWKELAAWAGYLVIAPNYRGSQGRGHAFAHSASGGIGEVDWPDIESMIDEMVRQGRADPNRLAVAGWSHGGSLAAWGVTKTKNRFKTAIVGGGVTNWDGMVMESGSPELEAAIGGAPWGNACSISGERKLSPVHQVTDVETAVLILHGEKDERMAVGQAVSFFRGLRRYGTDRAKEGAQLVIYPREPHGFSERKHAEDVLRRFLAFLEKWL